MTFYYYYLIKIMTQMWNSIHFQEISLESFLLCQENYAATFFKKIWFSQLELM